MFGNNVKSPIIAKGGDSLNIVDIFYTLQGEGPFAGKPAIFIRLGGCNLQCKFCDTEFDNYRKLPLDEIINQVASVTNVAKLVVITGGEPLLQPIEKLINLLLKLKFSVQIETNGTIFRQFPPAVHIVCSPKLVKGKYNISKELLDYADYFKFLISKSGEYNILPKLDISKPVYIQPVDEYDTQKNQANWQYALELSLRYNYIFSMQMHKLLGIK